MSQIEFFVDEQPNHGHDRVAGDRWKQNHQSRTGQQRCSYPMDG